MSEKAKMLITLDKEMKEEFTKLSKRLGANPTVLINMMIADSLNRGELVFMTQKVIERKPEEEKLEKGNKTEEKTSKNSGVQGCQHPKGGKNFLKRKKGRK